MELASFLPDRRRHLPSANLAAVHGLPHALLLSPLPFPHQNGEKNSRERDPSRSSRGYGFGRGVAGGLFALLRRDPPFLLLLPMRCSPVTRFVAAAEDARGNRGDGAGRGRGGFGRTGPRCDHGDADANGFEGGYGGGASYVAPRLEDGKGKQAELGRGPRHPYRGGGGRHGGYSDGQNTDEFGRPHRSYERRSGSGWGFGMKRDGAGRGNWGTATDEGFLQEHVEAVNTEETPAMAEDEKPEDEKVKEGVENAEEEKEAEEDKVREEADLVL